MKYNDTLNRMDSKPYMAPYLEEMAIQGRRAKRFFLSNLVACLLLALSITLFGTVYLLGHFTLNQSASMPLGLYKVTNQPIQRGSLVLLREPLKEIVAVPGDTVQWSAKGISVNGRILKDSAVPVDSPYPPYPYTTLKLAPDQYVAMGHHPLSFDARYTGPTPVSLIASTVQPFWTHK